MHFVVDELQQEPHDIPQDKGGDEIPVNHVPQTANAPVRDPGQLSAGTGCTWAQSSVGSAGPVPLPLTRGEGETAWDEGKAVLQGQHRFCILHAC